MNLKHDTTCSVSEDEWYHAADHFEDAMDFAQTWSGQREYHGLDLFGFSEGLSRQLRRAGRRSLSYDIKLNEAHDLSSKSGFYILLGMGLMLLPKAIVLAGPPCSLFVGASCSVHRRTIDNVWGNTRNKKVRLSNLLWTNFAIAIEILILCGRGLFYVFEQPASSWAFKLPCMRRVIELADMQTICTWMAFFGSDLQKPTHLVSNPGTISTLRRRMSKADRKHFTERLARRNSRRKIPRRYHKKVARPSGAQGWQGCRDLPQSAAYPYHFCLAILKLWTALFMSSSISVPVL